MMLTRRQFGPALAAFAALAAARPAAAAPVPLAAISAYLNGLQTVAAPFTQVNPDGSRSSGRVIIKRPGRMRFEYAKPDNSLVLASGGQVAIYDAKSNQPPEQYPLAKTPLNLILARNVDLGRAKMVKAHGESGGMTTVTAQDPDHPEIGTITLYFEPSPLRLAQWVVTDESGGQTLLKLGPLAEADFPPSTFSIDFETSRRN